MQRQHVRYSQDLLKWQVSDRRIGLGLTARIKYAGANRLKHRHEAARDRAKANEADCSPRQLAQLVRQFGIELPASAGARQPVEFSHSAERRQDQQQRHFGDGMRVRSRHVADRDAPGAGGVEVDRIDPDPDLLDQLEPLRRLDDGGRHRLQHMQKNFGVRHFAPECILVRFVDDDRREIERGNSLPKAGAGAVLQYRLHRGRHPAKEAARPSAASMRRPSFHLASRSERANDPTLSWPASQPTARWTIVTSSVSPERAETTVRQPACRAAASAALVSVTVPAWFGFSRTALHAPSATAAATRSAEVAR